MTDRSATAREAARAQDGCWIGHPLAKSLRCIRCHGPLPLLAEGAAPAQKHWRCGSCGHMYGHWRGMPVILDTESLAPVETYRGDQPMSFSRLKKAAPRIFRLLRGTFRTYARVESFLTPRSPLEPAFHLKRLKSELPPPGRRIVLDVGGGLAPYRALLEGESDTWVVLEKDRHHADELRSKGADADYLIGAAEDIPLLDGASDLVVLTEVLEHCSRPRDVVGEIARVLRPGGLCVGTVPQYWHVHGWPSDYFRYTMHGLGFLAEQAGLEVLRMEPKGGPILLVWAVLDLTLWRVSRLPIVSLVFRAPSLWGAWLLDRVFFSDPKKMTYPDTAGWAFLLRKSLTEDAERKRGSVQGDAFRSSDS